MLYFNLYTYATIWYYTNYPSLYHYQKIKSSLYDCFVLIPACIQQKLPKATNITQYLRQYTQVNNLEQALPHTKKDLVMLIIYCPEFSVHISTPVYFLIIPPPRAVETRRASAAAGQTYLSRQLTDSQVPLHTFLYLDTIPLTGRRAIPGYNYRCIGKILVNTFPGPLDTTMIAFNIYIVLYVWFFLNACNTFTEVIENQQLCFVFVIGCLVYQVIDIIIGTVAMTRLTLNMAWKVPSKWLTQLFWLRYM